MNQWAFNIKKVIFLIITVMAVASIYLFFERVKAVPPKVDYSTNVLLVDADPLLKDVSIYADLLRSPAFHFLHQNADQYYEDAIRFIKVSTHSERQKTIAARTMGGLKWNRLLDFDIELWKLFNADNLSLEQFKLFAFSPYEWNYILREHRRDSKVRQFMSEIGKSKKSDDKLKSLAADFLKE